MTSFTTKDFLGVFQSLIIGLVGGRSFTQYVTGGLTMASLIETQYQVTEETAYNHLNHYYYESPYPGSARVMGGTILRYGSGTAQNACALLLTEY